jgi:hypothetical protein
LRDRVFPDGVQNERASSVGGPSGLCGIPMNVFARQFMPVILLLAAVQEL